jgi:pyridoxal/pyridoxine/pyridoxamine kinase
VIFVQRFGSAQNLHIHFHMIVIAGVYTVDKSDKTKFQRIDTPNLTELRWLLDRATKRVVHRLEKRLARAENPLSERPNNLQVSRSVS